MPAFLLVVLGALKGWTLAAFGFLSEALKTQLGQILAAALAAFLFGAYHEHKVCARQKAAIAEKQRQAEAFWAKQLEAEQRRRDYAIKMAAEQARRDAKEIDQLELRLTDAKKEIDHASRANDHHPGLDARSLRRLNRLRVDPGRAR